MPLRFRLLSLAGVVLMAPAVLTAQRARRPHTVRRAAPPAPSDAPRFSAPVRTPVAVLPVDSGPSDSVRAILQRDFDYSDRIQIVAADSATPGAVGVVRARPTATGYSVALLDAKTGAVRQERDFPVPAVLEPRAAVLTDSLGRVLASEAAEHQAVYAGLDARRDSLQREMAKKPGHFWTRGARQAYQRQVALRDSLYRDLARQDSIERAAAHADTVAHDIVLQALVSHDAYARDSSATARRWAIHGIADEVVQWITGARGYAQSRIAYVADGQVHVVDADGANDHVITKRGKGDRALSPAWRHDGGAVVFADMNDAGTQIAWTDLLTGKTSVLDATRRGLNITPVFSPDDQWVLFANGGEQRTGLVAVKLDGSAPMRRIGSGSPWDNESPVFSPDGARIAFISSRPNTPEIYSVNLDGSDERLETPVNPKVRSYRTSPDWSPDGRAIAFEQQNGDFQVWLISRADHRMRKLTATGENEDPSWAPDSRHLALTSNRSGRKAIWVLDTESGRFRQLTPASDARLAAWSPVLHSVF